MNSAEHNKNKEKQSKIFVEKDVLGLEKQQSANPGTKTHPNRIFIALAVLVVVALLYWIITGK